jgi:signal transduction histidine kinase
MLDVRTKSTAICDSGLTIGADSGTDPERTEAEVSPSNETLATLMHELRSPLATIVYALETIPTSTDGDPATRQACAIALRQAWQGLRIVDDLFDLCAGSWSKLSLHKQAIGLAEIVARATESAEHLIAERMHLLTISVPREPVILDADPVRLEQVLTNLLVNAAKFTDPGGHIHLSAAEEAGQIVVRVRDDGRGIAPHFLPHVFDLFQQGPDDHRRGGLGLGLALVKCLVKLHGGSVTASSDGPGAGSEFVVRLPARPVIPDASRISNRT